MVVQWMRGLLSLEANSDLLGFVPATASNTLEVEDMFFSSATEICSAKLSIRLSSTSVGAALVIFQFDPATHLLDIHLK